jgi:hypothetical protein
MRRLAALLVVLCLSAPAPAAANPFCRWVGLCLYFSPGFELIVVDAETGKPLSGVYAWAEWVQYGAHGTGGPLVVQDAFSDADGRLKFPRWGPTWGSRGGLPLGRDPAVILFNSGYATLLVENGVALGADHRASIRGSSHGGETLRLRPLRNGDIERVAELRKLAYPGLHAYVSDAHLGRFRSLYLRRLDLVGVEAAKLSPDAPDVAKLRSAVEHDRNFVTGGR